jgi:hypothetical protein
VQGIAGQSRTLQDIAVQCRIENSEKNAEKCTEVHDSKKKKKYKFRL